MKGKYRVKGRRKVTEGVYKGMTSWEIGYLKATQKKYTRGKR